MGGGGGKSRTPTVEQQKIPSAPATAPEPEPTAQTPQLAGSAGESGSATRRSTKRSGTGALRINLNLNAGDDQSGLNIPT